MRRWRGHSSSRRSSAVTEQHVKFDWGRIQDISNCQFDASIRNEIENNIRWYRSRTADYADDTSSEDFSFALKALSILSKTEFSRSKLEPINDELATVQWFLDVMSQAPFERTVNAKYFLYSRIWTCLDKAGVKLTQGKGIQNHRLSRAQNVFREICRQAAMEFPSDQALADALKRALKAMSVTGAK